MFKVSIFSDIAIEFELRSCKTVWQGQLQVIIK